MNRVTVIPWLAAVAAVGAPNLFVANGIHAQQTAATATSTPAARICVLCDLGARPGDPRWPKEIGLFARGPDGQLYSTSPSGGKNNDQGTIFKVSPDDGELTVLYDFDFTAHGAFPLGGLVQGDGDSFYGTTYSGGLFPVNDKGDVRLGTGTVFSFAADGSEPQVLHVFRNGDLAGIKPELCGGTPQRCKYSPQQRLNAAASYPTSAPVRASDGSFYGVASFAHNQKLGVLYKLEPYKSESGITALCIGGNIPTDPDILDRDLREACMFTGENAFPSSLAAGANDDLYGVTLGTTTQNPYGTVFRATLDGKVATLHEFDSETGSQPHSITVARDGTTLYGTTRFAGRQKSGPPGVGVIYKITPEDGFEIMHVFTGYEDGADAMAGLVETIDADGKTWLYGATRGGVYSRGVLYRVSPDGLFEVLHRFPRSLDTGSVPSTTLFAMDGKLYGTTYQGGTHNNGTIFRLSGMDLPRVPDLTVPPKFYSGVRAARSEITVPGQASPVVVEVRTGVIVGQPTPVLYDERGLRQPVDDGITIAAANCRTPHMLQFVYRERLLYPNGTTAVPDDGDHQHSTGSYPLTTNPSAAIWRTDARGLPNAYHEQAGPVARIRDAHNLTIFDQPTFGMPQYVPGARETWRATFKTYVICNCAVVAEVRWAREVPWLGDHQAEPRYVGVEIVAPSDPTLAWANSQIAADGYEPIP